MLQVMCIERLKNNKGVITHYVLKDKQGVQKTISSIELKQAIKEKRIECVNIVLTSDNRLILVNHKNDNTSQNNKENNKKIITNLEMYNAYKKKMDALGMKQAEFKVSGKNIVLTKVLIKNGTFTIPPFVNKIATYKNESDATTSPVMCDVFSDCIDIKLINRSQITDMSFMFVNCCNLKRLDLTEFDTSKVTKMTGMFYDCTELTTLNVNNFDTSKVTDMKCMFAGCTRLRNINLSVFNTSKVINMQGMFCLCQSLNELDLSNFDTSEVTNMSAMFLYCESLKKLNLNSFDTSKVADMLDMFAGCINLRDLDISNFSTSKLIKGTNNNPSGHNRMFLNCKYKDTFKVPNSLTEELNKI